MGETVAVVLAGGRGSRVGAPVNKVLLDLAGTPVLVWSLRAFAHHDGVDRVLCVAHTEDLAAVRALITHLDMTADEGDEPGPAQQQRHDIEVIEGGALRPDSERAAFDYLREQIDNGRVDLILVHDGARPLVTAATISSVIDAARRHGAAVPGVPVRGLLRADGAGLSAVSEQVVRVQTPQGFAATSLLAAYDAARHDDFIGTDTASYLERYGVTVRVVEGDPGNLKVTWPADLVVAAQVLGGGRAAGR